MFVDRRREDRVLESRQSGWFDAAWARFRDWLARRRAGRGAGLEFSPRQELCCRLGHTGPLSLSGLRHCRVRCARGAVWVTVEGDARDRVLGPGQRLDLATPGKLVLSGGQQGAEVRVQWH